MSAFAGKELSFLGTRVMYNKTLRHLVNVTNIVDQVEKKNKNLGDLLNQMLEEKAIAREQIAPILSVMFVSRMNLPCRSMNLRETFRGFDAMVGFFQKANALDLVVTYHHPNLGVQLINPSVPTHWEFIHELKRDELIVVYARSLKGDRNVAEKGLDAFFAILGGKTPQEDAAFSMPVAPAPRPVVAPAPQAAAPAAQPAAGAPAAPAPVKKAAPAGKRNVSPRYSVQVTNELFHNGNVEAWKNIIEAYEAKTALKVIVYHEGELIQDLNSLFKWGKVKHGGVISFQVAGENLKFVSRLQKYLHEGASPRFEAFLKKDINRIINIF